jgi:hypothetical protein
VREVAELDELRRELERIGTTPMRWNADPDDVQRSVAQLVLTLVEFIRRLLERQAIRRMEAGTAGRCGARTSLRWNQPTRQPGAP